MVRFTLSVKGSEGCKASPLRAIDEILRDGRTIAVVGLSSNPARPSYGVASYMQAQGYRVIPVNPNETHVLGEPAFPSLPPVPGSIDLVSIFRKSKEFCL